MLESEARDGRRQGGRTDVRVAEIMTREVVTVRPATSFKEVVERMLAARVSGLPVVDGDGTIVGIVTEADIARQMGSEGTRPRALALLAARLFGRVRPRPAEATGVVAADVMTSDVLTCRPDEELPSVARRMVERGVKRMPVVEDGVLIGIVSRHDIMRSFARPDDDIATEVRQLVASHPPEDHHIECAVAQGIVTLTGDVRYAADEAIVEAVVRRVDGVVDVVNLLHHREPNPPTATDMWTYGVR